MLTFSAISLSALDLGLHIKYVSFVHSSVHMSQYWALAGPNLAATYWANRAAHLATSQTPLIVALAGKNNIITLLTGIGYEKVIHL